MLLKNKIPVPSGLRVTFATTGIPYRERPAVHGKYCRSVKYPSCTPDKPKPNKRETLTISTTTRKVISN